MSEVAVTTEVADPRHRVFLGQTFGERARGFWWRIAKLALIRWSPPAFNRWRVLVLRLFGAKVHGTARIAPSARINFPWNLRAGRNVTIAHQVILDCMGPIEIGDRTRISQYSHLCAGTHDYRRRDMQILRCPIRIGSDVWIAADAFVGPNVTIGDRCVLAARSSAYEDLEPGQIYVGNPARALRSRES